MLVNKKYVKRHSKGFVYLHWINAVCFFMLFLTALPLYADTFRFLYDMFGPATLQNAHRFFAVIFVLNPIVGLITAREGIGRMFSEVFKFNGKDITFLVKFPVELIGVHPKDMPKQGFYNGGERMNIALQLATWGVLVGSGALLWFGEGIIDNSIRAWMIPIHSLCAGIGFAGSISLVMNQGNIIHTIIHAMAAVLSQLPSALTAIGMNIMNIFVNFFIISGSGQAFVASIRVAEISLRWGEICQIIPASSISGHTGTEEVVSCEGLNTANLILAVGFQKALEGQKCVSFHSFPDPVSLFRKYLPLIRPPDHACPVLVGKVFFHKGIVSTGAEHFHGPLRCLCQKLAESYLRFFCVPGFFP